MSIEIVERMPYDDYAKHPGVNASLLATIANYSLAHAKAELDGERKRESEAFDFGEDFHALLLENRKTYVVHPDTYPAPGDHAKVKKGEIAAGDPLPWNWNANACKAFYAKNLDFHCISSEDESDLVGMVESAKAHPDLQNIQGRNELSVFVDHDGVMLKARLDILPAKLPVIIDLKSARSAQPEKFVRSAIDNSYHLKGAFYCDVARWAGLGTFNSFWFAAVEKEAPYVTAVVKFNDEPASLLRYGRRLYRNALHQLKNARETGNWKGYETCNAEDHAPRWMLEALESVS